jgi:hypothetical protein
MSSGFANAIAHCRHAERRRRALGLCGLHASR